MVNYTSVKRSITKEIVFDYYYIRPIVNWYRIKITMTRKFLQDTEGEILPIPRRFGYSYREFDTGTRIYYLIPLNVIVTFMRWLFASLKYDFSFYIEDKIRRIDNDRNRAP